MAKRFYKDVSVERSEDGYHVTLDGRRLKTPGKLPLAAPSKYIASCVAAEWDAQATDIKPETMPCTRLVNVAIEITPGNREGLVAEARKYAGTDLLCYRAPQPKKLVQRQMDLWDPILEWAAEQGVRLQTTNAILAIDQAETSLDVVEDYAAGLSDLSLTLFVHLTAVYGSAVLAMAVMGGQLSGLEALKLSRVDADYQIEKWGEDPDEAAKLEALQDEITALTNLLRKE